MNFHSRKPEDILFDRGVFLRIVMYVVIIIIMSNLNALVDSILHPDIPYLHKEHLNVGGNCSFVHHSLRSINSL